jgi:hypothetical protein
MLSLDSALIAVAAEFTGLYAPYQGVALTPCPSGGVFVAATDHGKVACIAFDPRGQGDEARYLLPSADLLNACKGLKTADREIVIDGETALVTTFRKSTSNEVKEFPVTTSQVAPPPLALIMRHCIATWGATPELSRTAGRYATDYVNKAVKVLGSRDRSLVFSSFDGGPLRIQTDSGRIVVLVMPQKALPIPPLPPWMSEFAGSCE